MKALRPLSAPGSLQAVFPYKAFKKSIAAWTQRRDEATVGDSCVLHQRKTQLASCQRELLRMLSAQLQRLNATLVEHEEELVIGWHELQEQLQSAASAEQQLHADMAGVQVRLQELLQQLVNFHGDAVLLLNWSQVNFSAVVKALKKFDKHMGTLLRMPLTQQILTQPFCCTEVITRLTSSAEQGVEQVTARMHQISLALTSGTRSAAPVADNASTVPAFSAVAAGAAAPADQGLAPAAAMDVSTDAKAASALVASSTYARLSEPSHIFRRQSTGVSVSDCAYNRLSVPEPAFLPMPTGLEQAFARMTMDASYVGVEAGPAHGPSAPSRGHLPHHPEAMPETCTVQCTVNNTAESAGACSWDQAEAVICEDMIQLYEDMYIDIGADREALASHTTSSNDVGDTCQAPAGDGDVEAAAAEVPAGARAPEGWPVPGVPSGPAADRLALCLGMSRRIRSALNTWDCLSTTASTPSTILSAEGLVAPTSMRQHSDPLPRPGGTLSAPLERATAWGDSHAPSRAASCLVGALPGRLSCNGWQEALLLVTGDPQVAQAHAGSAGALDVLDA